MLSKLSKEFWDDIHRKAVAWRNKKRKEVMEKQRHGEATDFEIQMINSWEKE